MLKLLKKKVLLNYIFPPYQPVASNNGRTDICLDENVNDHGLPDQMNSEKPVNISSTAKVDLAK